MSDIFHLLKVKEHQYLMIKPPKTNTMFLSFKNLKTAHRCKDYIEHHRKKYGTWPNLDMSKVHEKIVRIDMDPMSKHEPLYIEKRTLQDVEEMMQCSGAGMMYCHEFNVIPVDNSFTITFRAQELEVELDSERYLESLQRTIDS